MEESSSSPDPNEVSNFTNLAIKEEKESPSSNNTSKVEIPD
jgi:hypothetical protein